jgi:ribosome-binding factor A
MSSRRLLKAAAAVREVVSMAILTELRDPRVQDVTVTFVEVAPDMRSAKVHVSIMGNESKQNLGIQGLQRSAGFLQAKIAERIDTRYTPRLEFMLDKGVKNSIAVSQILQEVLPHSADEASTEEELPEETVPEGAVSREIVSEEQLAEENKRIEEDSA